jgi:C4-dicarboxylate transporter DctQ subunit
MERAGGDASDRIPPLSSDPADVANRAHVNTHLEDALTIRHVLKTVNHIEELFAGYTLLLLAVGATFQVVMRYGFNIAYDWLEEWARYLTVLITFVGAGLGVKYGTHFSMEALTQYLPDRFAHLLKVASNLISAVIMAVVCYFAWVQMGKLICFDVLTPATQMPMWIPYLPIGIFSVVISFRFLAQSIHHVTAIKRREPFKRSSAPP